MKLLNYVFAAALCLYLASNATALTVKSVDCSKGKSPSAEIAKMDQFDDYELDIVGTCTENLTVSNFEGKSLLITGSPTATINGVSANPPLPAIAVSNSRNVRINNLTVNPLAFVPMPLGGNTSGITLSACRTCTIANVTVNGINAGITWITSQGGMIDTTISMNGPGSAFTAANSSDVTLINLAATGGPLPALSFQGIGVDFSSRVRLSYTVAKQIKNFTTGIRVANGASVEGGGFCGGGVPAVCLEVRDNTYGLRITAAQGTVMSGVNFDNNKEGILVENGSIATLGPLLHVTGSDGGSGAAGNGITVTHSSHVSIQSLSPAAGGANNLTGNFRRGIAIASGSTVQLNGLAGSGQNNITGNAVADVACDATSLVTGTNTLPVGSVLSCVNQNAAPTPLP